MASSGDESPAIGIDLGTTYSCVAVYRRGSVEIIVNRQGNRITPSYVAFTESERLVGDVAFNQVAINAWNTVFDAKRLIGRSFSDDMVQRDIKNWPFKVVAGVGDKPLIVVNYKDEEKLIPAEEISSMVLGQMKEIAELQLGCPITKAVVTVPAYFNNTQRQATKDAAKIAGLDVIAMINEPTAAAVAYGLEKKLSDDNEKKNVLIFDLGGGTLDVTILVMEDGVLQVKATAGDTHLGGEDFDTNLVNHLVEEFEEKHEVDLRSDRKAIRRLRGACERAKRNLSFQAFATIDIDSLHGGIDFHMKLARAKFEDLNDELFTKCMIPLEQCLRDAKMDKEDVDEIVLVGGSTRIPKVQEMLLDFFEDKTLTNSINPDEAVANGAAIKAAMLSGVVQELVLIDVTSLSLGVSTRGDVMVVVVPRNTPIPTKKQKIFSTLTTQQTSVLVKIFEGERAMASDNNSLGQFELNGIVKESESTGPQIPISFNVDADGILTVSAKNIESGREAGITIGHDRRTLNEEDIERMIEDAIRYKAEDERRRKLTSAKNKLQKLAYGVRTELRTRPVAGNEEYEKMAKAVSNVIMWSEEQDDEAEIEEFDTRRAEVGEIMKKLKAMQI